MKKRILITGGAGFIGHHLIWYLLNNTSWDIVSLDRLDFSGNLNRINEILNSTTKQNNKRVKIVFHDLKAEINSMIENELGQFDYIVHMAAST